MSKIILRRPLLGDRQKLETFFKLMVESTFIMEGIGHLTEMIVEETEDKIKRLLQDLETDGESSYFIIAEWNDEIVGTIAVSECNELIIEGSLGELEGTVEVNTVFVRPDKQNHGIGKMLMKAMTNHLRKMNVSSFCMDSGYKRAQSIWTHLYGLPDYVMFDYWEEESHHMIWRVPIT